MYLPTRRVHLAGTATNPDEAWMKQIARNLTDAFEGFLLGKRYVIMDRDSKFSPAFRSLIEGKDRKVRRIPARSPNCNASMERFIRSIKDECLNRMIFFGEASLERAVDQYLVYFHGERNHQGLDNRIIDLPKYAEETPYYIRVHQTDGGQAWSSPLWLRQAGKA